MNELFKRILSSIVLIPTTLFFIVEGSYVFNIFIFICMLIVFYEWNKMTKEKKSNIFGFLFIIFSFYSIYTIRDNENYGYFYVILIILICILTDIGGYSFGKIFKGPKLIRISPKKTYSGMIGSYLLSIIFVPIFFVYLQIFFKPIDINFNFFLFIFLISTSSQLGDIIISFFKRQSNIKDTGRIIPGHGGLLDRIDGMIFAFPFSLILISTGQFKIF